MQTFDTVWAYLQARLAGAEIENWTAYKGYLGDKMQVVTIQGGCIEVDAPNAINMQIVAKEDFERIWQVWEGYKSRKVKRQELKPITRYSKYIISILHWYDKAQ